MADILLKVLVGIGVRLFTEKFMSALIIHSLKAAAERTDNKLDDKLVNDLAAALGVEE